MGLGRINREGEFHSHPAGQNWHRARRFCWRCDAFAYRQTPPAGRQGIYFSPRVLIMMNYHRHPSISATSNTSWIHSSRAHFWFTCSFILSYPFVLSHTKEASTTVSIVLYLHHSRGLLFSLAIFLTFCLFFIYLYFIIIFSNQIVPCRLIIRSGIWEPASIWHLIHSQSPMQQTTADSQRAAQFLLSDVVAVDIVRNVKRERNNKRINTQRRKETKGKWKRLQCEKRTSALLCAGFLDCYCP